MTTVEDKTSSGAGTPPQQSRHGKHTMGHTEHAPRIGHSTGIAAAAVAEGSRGNTELKPSTQSSGSGSSSGNTELRGEGCHKKNGIEETEAPAQGHQNQSGDSRKTSGSKTDTQK